MVQVPYIPETAPFTAEQRAWLNGFLAGLFAQVPSGEMPAPNVNGAPSRPLEPLHILFGSQTGTAEGLARRMAKEAGKRGYAPRVLPLNDYEQASLTKGGKAVIISSTWGDGDPPDNAAAFWAWLESAGAPRLDDLQFAVLGLGDRSYLDFCGASKKFDARLEALGARRIVPRGECDVDYEPAASSWMDALWEKLPPPNAVNGAPASPAPEVNGHALNGKLVQERATFNKSNPFPARLLKKVLLNKPGSSKEVWHHELSLAGSGLAYEVGDALGVMPANCPMLVKSVLSALCAGDDEIVEVGEFKMPVREAFAHHLDICKPSQDLLEAVARRVPGSELAALLAPEKRDDLKNWLWGRDVLDVIKLLETPLIMAELVPLLRKLVPRLYSISSSPKAHPDEVHLTVSAVRYENLGRARKGVASTFLADQAQDPDTVKVFVQASPGFKLPADGNVPIILVGPGTGIAPFRAFLEERQILGAKGKNWLFFGDQKRASDFLYEEQLCTWQRDGHLSRLDLAFSRDQSGKIYVQHRMLENAPELWSWLEAGAHFYVCGDATRMTKDVDAALHRIIETCGGKSAEDAKAYVAKLKSERRYQRDVY